MSAVRRSLGFVLFMSLVLGPGPPATPVPGGDFQVKGGINDPTGGTPGSFETTGLIIGHRNYRGRGYQCPKYPGEPFAGSPTDTVSVLTDASLTSDSRMNVSEFLAWGGWEGMAAFGFPYWKNTGTDGVYTCNWPDAGGYRVLARGVYRYDQTAPGQFALADVECATGYPRRDLVPAYYEYHFDEIERAGHAGNDWTAVGSTWQPHRFAWQTMFGPVDSFDLQVDGAPTPTWRPLYPSADEPRCSDNLDRDGDGRPDHVYVLDADPGTITIEPAPLPNEPVNFGPADVLEYAEWDNCGLVQVAIERQPSTLTVDEVRAAATPSAPPAQPECHWWPPDYTRQVSMADAGADVDSNRIGPTFVPWDSVVKRWQITAADPPVPTQMVWKNDSDTVHSVTASIDASGNPCIDETGGPLGDPVDRCDEDGRTHLFDSSPDCAPVTTATQSPLGCMKPGEQFEWTVPESIPAQLCEPGYCTIPYYCRISDSMRGNLIVSM